MGTAKKQWTKYLMLRDQGLDSTICQVMRERSADDSELVGWYKQGVSRSMVG